MLMMINNIRNEVEIKFFLILLIEVRKMKHYVYFVSYIGMKDEKEEFGRGQFALSKEITDIKDIKAIEEKIKADNEYESALIDNFELLRIDEYQ